MTLCPMIVTAMDEQRHSNLPPNPSTGKSFCCHFMLCLSQILLLDIPVSPYNLLTDVTHISISAYNVSDTACLLYSFHNKPIRIKPES